MSRLTKKDSITNKYFPNYPTQKGIGDMEVNFRFRDKCNNKLGQLEDLMEKYGIPDLEYLEKCIQDHDKYGELGEQIGCPLEVRNCVFYNSTIYNCLGYKMTVKETYDDHFIAVIENDIFSFDYKDHKNSWWLKEDRSE